MRGRGPLLLLSLLVVVATPGAQQAVSPVAAPLVAVRPITPPRDPLPPEQKTAGITRFSFLVYGDTRSGANGDGQVVHPIHSQMVDAMLRTIEQRRRGPFPVRFVLHTGDAVLSGADGRMWNVSFVPVVERLTKNADMPFFFTTGNHDATAFPAMDGGRARGMHNTISAMSGLIPAEGEPRRLNGYLTYAFGYGNVFVIAVDSNLASDPLQLAWVSDQLARLDRVRFPMVVVFLHHPPFSSGPHGVGNVEAQTLALRTLYMPLFRRYHVRLLLAGHDHFYDHWVERYTDAGREYRLDEVVTGGGGAPTYTYRGEPDLAAYVAAGSAMRVRLEHLARPATTVARNPNHFVVIEIDGDKISSTVIAPSDPSFAPFDGREQASLNDTNSAADTR